MYLALIVAACLSAGAVYASANPPAVAAGVSFIDGSTSSVIVERDGKRYLVDLAARSVQEQVAAAPRPNGASVFDRNCAVCHGAGGKGNPGLGTPNFTDPKVRATLTHEKVVETIRKGKKGTAMVAWEGKLTAPEIDAVASYILSLANAAESAASVYQPGDDYLMSLPTGRPPEAKGVYVNFSHRFAFDPAFSGPARGASLGSLDGVAISSFGFEYGVSKRLSVSAYRSPSLIARPIQLMGAYNLLSESGGDWLTATARLSIEGQNNFSRNFTENIELILARSITARAQLYFVPTLSFNNRHLILPGSFRSSAIPNLPGYNTFSTGVGAAVDIRPTVALVAEVIPTLVNGRPLDIHRPAYAFGIQKKILRHAFTIGFTNSPGTTVSQRAGTRASYLGDPGADTPAGLFVGFDLMRQLH
ncbi:MAG: DUF5777 family beta-barrel protein [Acidobacteriota bacterium]